MKKLMLVTLLVLCNTLSAMEENVIKLPSAEILKQRLENIGLQHFLEKTNLDKTLGDKEKYPLGVTMATELALYDYDEYMKNPISARQMQMLKPHILKTILQDHPEAIENLKHHGVLK